ncbi:taurine catabolism dioxygenase TauD [Photobacterium iliopiscarium]|uniref:TauD/TfdA family dioxygenase n=1 Tax=Photobacterium iliopiscarium TaxID=56192 RepID=UPI000D168637|nr:TauD/TfdA family dioxygenase [Photobacterium iliopiscarium]PST95677.1 taurine catabolism dioxygenase TauD [Photobacterium iliopiscarium]
MMNDNNFGDLDEVIRLRRSLKASSRHQILTQIDTKVIRDYGYQVIRNFGTNVDELEQVFDLISNSQLYYSERIGSICHQYSVEVSSDNFSQQMRTGGFHTDFMFQEQPPEYIALLCLETDPKHPIYGRNQVVSMSALLERLSSGFCLSIEELLQRNIPYYFANGQHFPVPLLQKINGNLQFKFHQHLASDSTHESIIRNKELSIYLAQLHAAMIDVSEDICLDIGDLLVISNHHALHRRSECSVKFDSVNKVWRSRKMATLRFNL